MIKIYKPISYDPLPPIAEFERIDGQERFYKIVGENYKVPSVTTILSKTNPEKIKKIAEWKKRIGEEEAYMITKESTGVGTALHSLLENCLKGNQLIIKDNPAYQKACSLFDHFVDEMNSWNKVKAVEYKVYYPCLYAGTIDILFERNGELYIGDFKTARKIKKEEHIVDYKLQLAAYKFALEQHGIYVNKGQIMMVSFDGQFQIFSLVKKDFDELRSIWFERVHMYYFGS